MKSFLSSIILMAACLMPAKAQQPGPFGFGGQQLQNNRADSLCSKIYRDINYVGDGEELGDIVVGRKFVDEVGERGESPCTTTEEYTGEGVAVLVDEDDEANVVDAKRDYRVEEPCAMGGRSDGEAGGAEEAEEVPIACPGPGERG